MKESRTVEFKREASRSFLKTVSAYANFTSGDILFGIDDEGRVIGIPNPESLCHDLENVINDSISPLPRFTLETKAIEGHEIVVLHVFEGRDKPYLYKGKAYRRSNTSDVVVDRLELNRLVLEGQNLSFEEIPSKEQNLTFAVLGEELRNRASVEEVDKDVLKTLRLYSKADGYNNAAAILADKNCFNGIDVVRFGDDMNEIRDRERFIGVSALSQLDGAISLYRRYYQYQLIEGMTRNTHDRIPEEAFREAVANALVHRTWDTPANIQISMEESRVRITSPGGLPTGISLEEYLNGHVSVLRNPILGNVFYRLDYIEMFGTGVARIMSAYNESNVKPMFSVTENSITVELPALDMSHELTNDEKDVLRCFGENRVLSRTDIQRALGISQAKAGRMLNSLISKGRIVKQSAGRATKYRIA